jgi:hypothetical protein
MGHICDLVSTLKTLLKSNFVNQFNPILQCSPPNILFLGSKPQFLKAWVFALGLGGQQILAGCGWSNWSTITKSLHLAQFWMMNNFSDRVLHLSK